MMNFQNSSSGPVDGSSEILLFVQKRRDDLATFPKKKEFIFGRVDDQYLMVKYSRPKKTISLDVDQILDKIKTDGIDSLTIEEKFLDDFEN